MQGVQGETRRRGSADWLAAVADPIRVHILRSLSQLGVATAADLSATAAASHQTLRRHLEALVTTGVLDEHPGQSDGETPGRPPSRFSLNPETRDSIRQVFGSAP
ncbi:MAG TPA: helix-turn-helix domain-containing protein [Solirubrobacterales bacterium]|nr:helix-turn-helix domain-containing protein [Solirubrobacterales bacterium]